MLWFRIKSGRLPRKNSSNKILFRWSVFEESYNTKINCVLYIFGSNYRMGKEIAGKIIRLDLETVMSSRFEAFSAGSILRSMPEQMIWLIKTGGKENLLDHLNFFFILRLARVN